MIQTSPGDLVGVVGGGQLGRMLGEAAGPLGIDIVVSDPTPNAPAASVVRDQLVGDFDDRETLFELGERADFLTYEIELADPDILDQVSEETGTPVHPSPETLRTIEDKLVQKRHLAAAGVPVPEYQQIDSAAELRETCEELGYPAMLKARTGGYDGRGNVPVMSPDDVEPAFEALDAPAMVEEFVDYKRELAVMGCIGENGIDTFPVTETVHEDEILRSTLSPPRAAEEVLERAREVARTVLDAMTGRGVFGIELFQDQNDKILFNEVAPRPHNSGHWTIEGCYTSQFEQHLRAITGRPLGSTERQAPTVSTNILGDVAERQPARLSGIEHILEAERASLHWYGKREVYELRKMGHVTFVGKHESIEDLHQRAVGVRDTVRFE